MGYNIVLTLFRSHSVDFMPRVTSFWNAAITFIRRTEWQKLWVIKKKVSAVGKYRKRRARIRVNTSHWSTFVSRTFGTSVKNMFWKKDKPFLFRVNSRKHISRCMEKYKYWNWVLNCKEPLREELSEGTLENRFTFHGWSWSLFSL